MPKTNVSHGVDLISEIIEGRPSDNIQWSSFALVKGFAEIYANNAKYRNNNPADEIQ
jgi:hypothetical protein